MTEITLTELRTFHNKDRQAYARLVFQLGLDCDTSKKIIAFWYCLEIEGYRNFVHNSLALSDGMLQELAIESTLCLNSLDDEVTFLHDGGVQFPLMSIVGGKTLSLEFVYTNKEIVKRQVTKFITQAFDKAFSDIVPKNLNNQMQEDNGKGKRQVSGDNHQDLRNGCAQTDRKLFVTFSRGHPIAREQLGEFFNRRYGQDCVKDIVAHDHNGEESLYALVIVSSPSYTKRILGDNRVVQFNIHGKDIRVRRFITKGAASASVSAL